MTCQARCVEREEDYEAIGPGFPHVRLAGHMTTHVAIGFSFRGGLLVEVNHFLRSGAAKLLFWDFLSRVVQIASSVLSHLTETGLFRRADGTAPLFDVCGAGQLLTGRVQYNRARGECWHIRSAFAAPVS